MALEKETITCLAEDAEVHAAGVADLWVKEQWQHIAAAYRELAQTNFAPTNAAEQIDGT
jgi:hypothetical protein